MQFLATFLAFSLEKQVTHTHTHLVPCNMDASQNLGKSKERAPHFVATPPLSDKPDAVILFPTIMEWDRRVLEDHPPVEKAPLSTSPILGKGQPNCSRATGMTLPPTRRNLTPGSLKAIFFKQNLNVRFHVKRLGEVPPNVRAQSALSKVLRLPSSWRTVSVTLSTEQVQTWPALLLVFDGFAAFQTRVMVNGVKPSTKHEHDVH